MNNNNIIIIKFKSFWRESRYNIRPGVKNIIICQRIVLAIFERVMSLLLLISVTGRVSTSRRSLRISSNRDYFRFVLFACRANIFYLIAFDVRPARTFRTFRVTTRTHTMNEKRDAVANATLVAKSVIIRRFGHPVVRLSFFSFFFPLFSLRSRAKLRFFSFVSPTFVCRLTRFSYSELYCSVLGSCYCYQCYTLFILIFLAPAAKTTAENSNNNM